MREFVEKEITPFAFEWDEKKAMPKEMYGPRFCRVLIDAVTPRRTELAGSLACAVPRGPSNTLAATLLAA